MKHDIGIDNRIPVAVLGATGAVGQTFVRLLHRHPWFRLAQVAASERSAGRPYAEAAHWMEGTLPDAVGHQTVLACDPGSVTAPIVFSALDAAVAGDIEMEFVRAGRMVCSNARNHRLAPDVPLLIPEINAPHLQVIGAQRLRTGSDGAIVTNANCASTIAALALAPLHEHFGIARLFIATMQAVSGAGYPGVPSLDILGNVIPHISGEEDKIEAEIGKLLGSATDAGIESAALQVAAHANRVPVENGHTVCMSVELKRRAELRDVTEAIESWTGSDAARELPSRPARPLVVSTDPDRPQPRRDVHAGGGMSVTVGRIRPDPLFDVRMVAMGSNTVRGAAGGAILNAELLVSRGLLNARAGPLPAARENDAVGA